MAKNNQESMAVLDILNPLTNTTPPKNIIAQLEKKVKLQKVFTAVVLLLILVTLPSLIWNAVYISKLQQDIDKLKQKIDGTPQNSAEKQTGAEELRIIKPKNEVKMAAHLTGKASTGHSARLKWEIYLGHAFTQGIQYKDGALIINETGQYFIYAKVYFRGMECESNALHQTVVKRNEYYQKDLNLMEVNAVNYCSGSGTWGKSTFQAGIFHLSEGAQLFVKVSHPSMVSNDELMTFFGVYKI
ncbi:tumor necrosis factor ligand superfamily member 6-like isoform X1 [Mustelus asterias]